MGDVVTVWSSERLLMRFEALSSAGPSSALHWRSQIGLAEAALSAQLEGQHFDPPTLLIALMHRRIAPNFKVSEAVRAGEAIWHHLAKASGSNADFQAAATIGILGAPNPAGATNPTPPIAPERMKWALEKLNYLGRHRSLPLLPRLAVVPHIFREAYGSPLPVAERLWIMLADQKWRRTDDVFFPARKPVRIEGDLLLEQPLQARWLVAPASLTGVAGSRIWSLENAEFKERFIRCAEKWLCQQLDTLHEIRRWEDNELADFSKSGSGGARTRFVQMIGDLPILDVSLVARHLQVHERTARRVLNEAAEASVIVEIMGRYRNRIWAAPGLAHWAHSTRSAKRQRVPTTTPPTPETINVTEWEGSRGARDARLQAMIDDLDALSKGVLNLTDPAL